MRVEYGGEENSEVNTAYTESGKVQRTAWDREIDVVKVKSWERETVKQQETYTSVY